MGLLKERCKLELGSVGEVTLAVRVKRIAADWRSRTKIEPNTVGRQVRFGTMSDEVPTVRRA